MHSPSIWNRKRKIYDKSTLANYRWLTFEWRFSSENNYCIADLQYRPVFPQPKQKIWLLGIMGSIYEKANGKWRVVYDNPDEKERNQQQKTFNLKKDAENFSVKLNTRKTKTR